MHMTEQTYAYDLCNHCGTVLSEDGKALKTLKTLKKEHFYQKLRSKAVFCLKKIQECVNFQKRFRN